MKARLLTVMAAVALVAAMVSGASAAPPPDTSGLRNAVTVEGVRAHQAAFQAIADANGGTRSASTDGYSQSVDYVVAQLEAAGYEVSTPEFDYLFFGLNDSAFEQVSPDAAVYVSQTDYDVMTFSGSGDAVGVAEGVDLSLDDPSASTSGCEATDFDGFTAGNIALIQRGACTFFLKAANAEAAGAIAVVVFNQGTEDRQDLNFGTLGDAGVNIPTITSSFTLGSTLEGTTLRVFVDAVVETRTDRNVIAETAQGRDDKVIVVGAHLDSVPAGPGIQDNGSGSAAILEIAIQMANLGVQPTNKVRFAWWGAEELGLLGSQAYVDGLSEDEIANISMNLNFDMIGSPNFVRFVYDGDGSDTGTAGPKGSPQIEQVFNAYFASQGLAAEATAFSGRSDYGPFIAVGIPAGGLFTGAEGIKTEEQAAIYGGVAGEQYDPCYHLACDTFDNISLEALDQNADAAAHAIMLFSKSRMARSGGSNGSATGAVSLTDLDYLGTHSQR